MTKNVPTRWSLAEIKSATLGFHRNRIVGEAIGSCYNVNFQCTLADGNEIAVKRLSKTSSQGLLEFKNEELPEYAMEGQFSVRSDVFSFGVLLLEIITGKRNNGFHLLERGESLLIFAWKLWSKGEAMELIEEHLLKSSVPTEVLKCIQIGLLCVQADPVDGPTVVAMLGKDTITLPLPAEPAFCVRRIVAEQIQPNASDRICSVNEVTISNMSPR
ncbi:Cysteine-rich RLK (RECEPTOR-like protein kinase) 26 [Hibiscus syriacus]|uniref:Cysteine-rich RLK (RECEPTOR-like protein kinase) 26 n=1 Tax=Hibiscus syriacus TaxID=106335 RepID=A0A6A3C9D4_HIBSY|nr:Cysteine-rich RLK (RECEPTOR-like protein kinase) 26 [Hibiscus syriacus]